MTDKKYKRIDGCYDHLPKDALDLINRQNEEIERLLKAIEDKHCVYEKRVVTEAIKEFAERLKENISDDCHIVSDEGEYVGYDCDDVIHCIDNLVKEMTEVNENDDIKNNISTFNGDRSVR